MPGDYEVFMGGKGKGSGGKYSLFYVGFDWGSCFELWGFRTKKYLGGVGSGVERGVGPPGPCGPCNLCYPCYPCDFDDWTYGGLEPDLQVLCARFGWGGGLGGSVWNPARLSGIRFWMTFLCSLS